MAAGERDWLRLPVVSAGSEYLVMGHLMRRNILTYKAPPGNEGYDLICLHPDPRHQPGPDEKAQIRVQVKSRYASDCGRSFPVNDKRLDAFDYLVVAFLNIGNYNGKNDGSSGAREPEFFTLPQGHLEKCEWRATQLAPQLYSRELDACARWAREASGINSKEAPRFRTKSRFSRG
jgi:hypothetical protein